MAAADIEWQLLAVVMLQLLLVIVLLLPVPVPMLSPQPLAGPVPRLLRMVLKGVRLMRVLPFQVPAHRGGLTGRRGPVWIEHGNKKPEAAALGGGSQIISHAHTCVRQCGGGSLRAHRRSVNPAPSPWQLPTYYINFVKAAECCCASSMTQEASSVST